MDANTFKCCPNHFTEFSVIQSIIYEQIVIIVDNITNGTNNTNDTDPDMELAEDDGKRFVM